MAKKKTVWRNDETGNFDDWKKDYIEHLELNNREVPKHINDNDVYEFISDSLNWFFEDECINLSGIDKGSNGFLLVADIGLWNGRVVGYKTADSIEEALRSSIGRCDYAHIYVEGGKLKTMAHHHDGTNYVEIREWNDLAEPHHKERVMEAIYNRKDDMWNLVRRHTRSLGRKVGGVYGWN